jgi:hypothetical protein
MPLKIIFPVLSKVIFFKADWLVVKRAHLLREQETGKGESLGTRVIFYLALMSSKFAKILMLDAMRISCYYRENTK